MFSMKRSQVQPIGLDIGFDCIKMMQLEEAGRALTVVAAAKQPFPESARGLPPLERTAAITDILKGMFRQQPFRGRRVVASLPREFVHVKNLRVPPMPASELEAVVAYEAKNVFPFDTDRARVDFLPAGEVRQGVEVRQEIIALAAKNDEVDDFVETLHRGGAIVESLDAELCALYRGLERFIRRREDEQDVHVIVDLGWRRTQVVIGKGRDINFYKPIDIGARQLHESISRKLGISPSEARALRRRLIEGGDTSEKPADETADVKSSRRDPVRQAVVDATRSVMEELAREISLCLRYYSVTFRGHRPTKVRLLGGEARDPQLQEILGHVLTIPVEAGRPLHSVDALNMNADDQRGTMSEWAVAFGLSLKLTKGYFGARDGKAREKAPPLAEVVDLDKAVGASIAAAGVAPKPASSVSTAPKPIAPTRAAPESTGTDFGPSDKPSVLEARTRQEVPRA